MNSLRGRLTFANAIAITVVLALLSLLASRIAFEVLACPTLDAFALSVARVQNIAGAPSPFGPHEAVARAIAAATTPGIIAFEPGDDGDGPHDGPPPSSDGGPPGGDGPPPGRPPPDAPHFGRGHGGPAQSPFNRIAVAPLLGLDERTIDVHGYPVVIAPDFERLRSTFQRALWLLFGLLALSVVLAWTFASWLANHAIAPLVTLTHELERFAAGDFAPRSVTTSERGELGALMAAFNGAAAQVADAFSERLEVEQHMRRFIADAGHELRTPLTVIAGYLEILRKGGVDDPPTRERALVTLTGESRRMRMLVDRLLVLARLERPDVSQLAEVSVGDVAADAIAHVRAARGGDISLDCASQAAVFADPAELSEAIENVVDNAVKYGRQSPVRVRIETAGDEVFIRVCDGGPGIPASERTRLFERFFRGDDRGEIEGTGLGLAIAERAISRCNGRIVLEESNPGRTIFTLTIPIAPARKPANASLRV